MNPGGIIFVTVAGFAAGLICGVAYTVYLYEYGRWNRRQ